MKRIATDLPDVLLFEPKVFGDERGFFLETYNKKVLAEYGVDAEFVQDNHSRSARGVLRGIHYQIQQPQGKLVRVTQGEVFDVAVDLRRRSPTFGKWAGFMLSAESKRIAWIPPGFGHGFLVVSEFADFLYKTTDYYAPIYDRCIVWNDPDIGIAWPLNGEPTLSSKDQSGKRFKEAEVYS